MTTPGAARALLALLCTAQFLVVLDMTIVNVALPSLQSELGLPAHRAHWVVSAYAIAFGGFLLVGGRAADAFGRRRVLVAGAGIFTAASLACGLAPSELVLIAARAAQGIGGALVSTSAFGILLATFQAGPSRTRAIATWGSIGALGGVLGFASGGALTELVGWRAVFLAVVPVGIGLVVLAPRLLPASRARREIVVDVPGAALATAGVAAIAFVVSDGAARGFDVISLAAGVGATVALGSFVVRESRAGQPLVPAVLIRDRSFLTASAAGVAYGSTMLGVLMLLAAYLQVGRGLTALQAGLVMLLLRAPVIGWARVAGRLVARFGPQPFLMTGTGLMAAGALLLARLPADGSLLLALLPGLLVVGVAMACLAVSVPAAALRGVDADDAGVGSGLLTTFQWVGGALAFAVVSAIAAATISGGDAPAHEAVALTRAGFLGSAAVCSLALVAAAVELVVRRPRARARAHGAGRPSLTGARSRGAHGGHLLHPELGV